MSITDIETLLSEAVRAHHDGDGSALLGAINEVGDPGQLQELLTELIADEARLTRCAIRSYQHPNKFSKIVLLEGADPAWRLRMHLWWPQRDPVIPAPGRGLEHIHNHRWDFGTVLLRGSYLAQEFVAAEDGDEELYRYEYFSPEGGDTFRLSPKGRIVLRQVLNALLPAGTSYVISHRVLHRIISDPRKLTATLFLQGPVCKGSTDVCAPEPVRTGQHGKVEVKVMDPDQTRRELRSYLSIAY
jgi:hypothetical protein